MSDLDELLDPLRRAVAVPGTFSTVFPDTQDDDLVGVLADAVAEAMLDGYLNTYELNIDLGTVTPDLTPPQQALVVIYAGYRILISEVRNRKSHVRYEAGPTVFEEDQTASMLNEILRQIGQRKKDLLEQARLGQFDTDTYVADLYFHKATGVDFRLGWYGDLAELAFQGA